MNNPASLYSVTSVALARQMDILKAQGYQTITISQYVAWVRGEAVTLPAKPVLVTFDDNIISANAATAILNARGLKAVMYAVQGFADNPQGWNMDWAALRALQSAGWNIQLHAGPKGHALSDQTSCPYFYGCRTSSTETDAAYKARVKADIAAGLLALKNQLGVASSPSFAVPWDFWGQTGTDSVIRDWFPAYLASQFDVVFNQDYGYTNAFNRRYRFEVHSDTTDAAFTAMLKDSRFGAPLRPTSIPVLGYHQMNQNNLYSVTTEQFTQQMDLLFTQGYRTITPQQYVAWLQGNNAGIPLKPILITFDDNIGNARAATPILQERSMKATMYVVSGFADFPDNWNMDWAELKTMMGQGWSMQLHAGPSGHSVFTSGGPDCQYFYACRVPLETAATYQARVRADLTQGLALLKSKLGVDSSPTFALPWDFWGQDKGDTVVTSFLPAELQSRFPVVFEQDYGYTNAFNRRYRFEVHSDTTLAALQTALGNVRFARVVTVPK